MKIGIVTYHRTHNYGGCLQAVATRIVMSRMGHDTYYIDYWPEYHNIEYSLFNKNKYNNQTWKGKIKFLLLFCLKLKNIIKRRRNFNSFLQTFVTPYCKGKEEEFDVIIYGSDQIWRKQASTKWYNPVYFGINNFKAKKHITLSASMGVLPQTDDELKAIMNYTSRLDSIAVRESDLQARLISLIKRDVTLTLDPTLLLDSSTWDRVFQYKPSVESDYILIYSLWGDTFEMNSVNELAKKEKLKIITLKGEAGIRDNDNYITTADPKRFVALIKGAKYVLTSSFHGLVFSIIYRKQFFTSFNHNGGRAKSLLQNLEMSDRYLEPNTPLPSIMPIDYERVEKQLNMLKEQTFRYLFDSIST